MHRTNPGHGINNNKKLAKTQLTSNCLLVYFDPNKEILLSCDASPYGVGAVLSHQLPDETERPIAFTSRSLSPAEKKYSHLDKEGLEIVTGVKKFHQYLYGRKFTICSDHLNCDTSFGAGASKIALILSSVGCVGLQVLFCVPGILLLAREKHTCGVLNSNLLSQVVSTLRPVWSSVPVWSCW